MHLNWPIVPGDGKISADEVQVWAISVECFSTATADLVSLLSEEERQRASRFHFEKDKLRFVTARGILRTIIGTYLGKKPAALNFTYGKNGKPELGHCKLKFNVSHADNVVLFAISKDRPIGVDVEKLQDFPDVENVADRFFLPEEIVKLKRFSGPAKLEEFYRCWTRGEALLKWSGEGIVEPEQRREISRLFNGTIHELAPAPDYAAALAVSGAPCSVSKRQWGLR